MSFRSFLARFQVQTVWATVRDACMRFPVTMACCTGLFALMSCWNHDMNFARTDAALRVHQWLWMFGGMGLSVKLWAEGQGISARGQIAAYALSAAVTGLACFATAHFSALHIFLGAAIALSVLFAPYIGGDADEDSFWYRNYLTAITLALGLAAAMMLGAGASAIVGSISYLFEIGIAGKFYGDIWLFSSLVFAPVVSLSYLPRDYVFAKQDCALHAGVAFIANYLLVPLMLVYMGVLYAYTLRILFMMELPRGNVAAMVTGFGVLGVMTHLAVYALRERGTVLLRQYYAHFYKIMAVPLALLAVGLYARVAAYGVTPERYAVGVALVWLALLSLAHVFARGRVHIKYVPMTLCVLCLLASIGPLGAERVSVRSQKAHLQSLLTSTGVLQANGTLEKTSKTVPYETRQRLSSVVTFFYDTGTQSEIANWVAPFAATIKKTGAAAQGFATNCGRGFFARCDSVLPRLVVEAWGMDYVDRWQPATGGVSYYNFNRISTGAGAQWRKVAPYDYVTSVSIYSNGRAWLRDMKLPDDAGGRTVVLSLDKQNKLTLSLVKEAELTNTVQASAQNPAFTFDLQKLADGLYAQKISNVPIADDRQGVLEEKNAQGMAVKIILTSLNGEVQNGHVKIGYIGAQVLFTPPLAQ